MNLRTFLAIVLFMIGIYFYAMYNDESYYEGLKNNNYKCPNLLIQKDKQFYLYNSKLAKVPGVNPIEFDNLEDYVEFLEWQKSQGIRCPVLYLQQTFDAQGNPVYKPRPDVMELEGGLPPTTATNLGLGDDHSKAYPNSTPLVDATRNDPPYNKNSYPSYDESSQYVGATTPLDLMDIKKENASISPDPMDSNWGGPVFTAKLVKNGYYKDNYVTNT